MRLYHGSSIEVRVPDTAHSRKAVDFGPGFYLTPIRDQAARWCEKFSRLGRDAFLNAYEFDEAFARSELQVVEFESYSAEWLRCVSACRLGDDAFDCDIVVGGVADDKVFNTCELYFEGRLSAEEALDRLRYEKPNAQYCFKTERAISEALEFLGAKRL